MDEDALLAESSFPVVYMACEYVLLSKASRFGVPPGQESQAGRWVAIRESRQMVE